MTKLIIVLPPGKWASRIFSEARKLKIISSVLRRQQDERLFECGMPANAVVKTLGIFKDGLSGLGPALKTMSVNALPLESRKEALHSRVVVAVSCWAHANPHS